MDVCQRSKSCIIIHFLSSYSESVVSEEVKSIAYPYTKIAAFVIKFCQADTTIDSAAKEFLPLLYELCMAHSGLSSETWI